ncbi:MAG: hypothetical protein ACOZB3_04080 [Calditrichota bacterium]
MRNTIVTLVMLIAAAAMAQTTFNDPILGQRPGAFSARSMGLGHTFLTDQNGPAALMGNPATMAEQQTQWLVDMSADVSRITETRKYPVYDSFDGVIIYNNYAMNDHLYSKLDGGVSFKIPLQSVRSLVASMGTYSTYRFDYRYHEEVRSRFSSGGIQDLRLGHNRIDVTGDLRSASFGAAVRSFGPLSAGFSVNILSGKWDYERGVYYANSDSANYMDHIVYRPDNLFAELNLGAMWELNPRITLGARALLPTGDYKIDQRVELDEYFANVDSLPIASGTITTTYPSHYALGVRYRPQNEFRPILLLEGELHTYHDVDPDFDNTFEIRAGAEQQVVAGTPVRVGFVFASAPDNKDRTTAIFTAGIGFSLQKLSGDFGVEIGKVAYVENDLFPQRLYTGSAADDRSDSDRVETSTFRGLITLRYAL